MTECKDGLSGYVPTPDSHFSRHSPEAGRVQNSCCLVELNGVTKSLKEWSKDDQCVVPLSMLQSRIFKLGWTLEESLTTPPSDDVKEKITALLETLKTSKMNPPRGFKGWSSRAIACHLGIPSSYRTVARILRKKCDDIVV